MELNATQNLTEIRVEAAMPSSTAGGVWFALMDFLSSVAHATAAVLLIKGRTYPSPSTKSNHHLEAVHLECTADHLLADLSKVAESVCFSDSRYDSRSDSDSGL